MVSIIVILMLVTIILSYTHNKNKSKDADPDEKSAKDKKQKTDNVIGGLSITCFILAIVTMCISIWGMAVASKTVNNCLRNRI